MSDGITEAARDNIQTMLLELLYEKRRDGLYADDVAAPPPVFVAEFALNLVPFSSYTL